MYVNGHLEDSDVFMELGTGLDTPISLGCYIVDDTTNEIAALTQGVMDDVRIYNYGLSEDEVGTITTSSTVMPYICRWDDPSKAAADVNGDCRIDQADIDLLQALWLECGRWPTETCE